ncbi:MAG: cytochrome c biogenesis protein CcsA [Spirochaetales bacterium]|nr:cytochrome c biogenesis protein CcsA [Spirochaetales bacterium]
MAATVAFILICISAVSEVVFLLRKTKSADPFSHLLHLTAAALLFFTTVYRSIKIDFVAVTNTFESLVFFSACVLLILFVYRVQKRWKVVPLIQFGATIMAILLLAVASSPLAPSTIQPPIPALQSYWLVLHVTLSFIGEAFFVVGFVSAIYYLAVKDDEKKKNADRILYTSIAIGYPIFTAGALIFGAIWAEAAWGAYWSWDPKETWALITWFTYTAFLHSRLVKQLRGKVSAYLSIIGFAFTLFTFFGVNYLLSGLHSYG